MPARKHRPGKHGTPPGQRDEVLAALEQRMRNESLTEAERDRARCEWGRMVTPEERLLAAIFGLGGPRRSPEQGGLS